MSIVYASFYGEKNEFVSIDRAIKSDVNDFFDFVSNVRSVSILASPEIFENIVEDESNLSEGHKQMRWTIRLSRGDHFKRHIYVNIDKLRGYLLSS